MGIHELIRQYAELERMLFRPVTDIYENLQLFAVAADGDQVVGCCALQVVWSDLAEIKSLAVRSSWQATVTKDDKGLPAFTRSWFTRQDMYSTKRVLPVPVGPLRRIGIRSA